MMKSHVALRTLLSATALAAVLCSVSMLPARAIVVFPNADPNYLVNALMSGTGINVLSVSLSYQDTGTALSVGTFTNSSGTYGIGPGIVLSTGNVAHYGDGSNTSDSNSTGYGTSATAAQEALLDPITGGSYDHFDVTQLDLTFTTSTGDLSFNVVFGSEEYPEYVGTEYVDAFGMYLDGVNIALVGGQPVNTNHPQMAAISGTELDGVLAPNDDPLLWFGLSGLDPNASHTLTFILADTSDDIYDTTVYISSLSGGMPVIPEPGTWALMLTGLAPVATRLRRRNA